MKNYVIAAIAGTFALATTPAHAYNFDTHTDIVESATMVIRHTPPGLVAPMGVSPAAWKAFLAAIAKAPNQLGLLRTDLGIDTVIKDDTVCKCGFDASVGNFNFATYGTTRLKESKVWPAREQSPCGIASASLDGAVVDQSTGKILGYHAGKVDDHVDDLSLVLRPLAAGQNDVSSASQNGGELILGGVLVPIACVISWIQGHSCPDDVQDLGSSLDPAKYLDNAIAFGLGGSADYTGIWHFEDVRASIHTYNSPRGMFYPEAGPYRVPGAIDVLITLGTASLGVMIDATSDGVTNYGQYDLFPRSSDQWQSRPLGMTEFSALHNLARYGWEAYKKDPGGSRNLGWPLHAIGDAVEPHHVVGTTSWGHRPMEDFVASNESLFVKRTQGNGQLSDPAQRDRILARAFAAWTQLSASKDVAKFITDTATWTSDHVLAEGDWPYDDYASQLYALPGALGGDQATAINGYSGRVDVIRELLEEGVARSIALLLFAAPLAKDPGAHDQCAPMTHYNGSVCEAGTQMPCGVVPNPCVVNQCTPSSCLTLGVACGTDIDCCSHHCTGGKCTAGAPDCVGDGQSCGLSAAGPACCSGNCLDQMCHSCVLAGAPCGAGTEGTCCGTCDPMTSHCAGTKP